MSERVRDEDEKPRVYIGSGHTNKHVHTFINSLIHSFTHSHMHSNIHTYICIQHTAIMSKKEVHWENTTHRFESCVCVCVCEYTNRRGKEEKTIRNRRNVGFSKNPHKCKRQRKRERERERERDRKRERGREGEGGYRPSQPSRERHTPIEYFEAKRTLSYSEKC